jgi:hypothetical protein
MKTFMQRTLALTALAAVACWNSTASAQVYDEDTFDAGSTEQRSVLMINVDGSSLFTTTTVESRTVAEQQVRMREHYEKMSEAADEADAAAKTDISSTNETKPFTDEELAKKMSEPLNDRDEEAGQKSNVEVKKDAVVITTTRSFATLEDMLKESYTIWSPGGVAFENARIEIDTNGLLRVTLTPRHGMERYMKTFRSQWKLSGAKSELKLVFPGKVVASGFTAMQTNATWLALNGKDDASLDAVVKLYAVPTVITAEAGGLKLEQPLESKKLWRSRGRRGEAGNDLPITDAGAGFVTEAQSITTTTLHVFPGGEDYFKQNGNSSGWQTGAMVTAKFFAPRGRTLQSVGDLHVITAVDNKGRSVVAEPAEGEDASSETFTGDSPDASSVQIQIHLQLPQPDAQAIDTISAEAVALTAGTWKEMTLTNLQANATNEIDLATVLPGAKLVITKQSIKNGQFSLQAHLKGPRSVQHLDVSAKIPGNDNFNSNSSERQSSSKGGETTRTLMIQGYGISDEVASPPISPILIIRYPEDLRRERVKFELSGLDLL